MVRWQHVEAVPNGLQRATRTGAAVVWETENTLREQNTRMLVRSEWTRSQVSSRVAPQEMRYMLLSQQVWGKGFFDERPHQILSPEQHSHVRCECLRKGTNYIMRNEEKENRDEERD